MTRGGCWCYASGMLTRLEVEGQLRSLHPMRQNAQRVRRAHWKTRRRARVTVAILLGIGLVTALGVARVRSAWVAQVATLQDSEWGAEYVGSYRSQPHEPLFPATKRSRWDSWAARAHAAGRDPITGERRLRPRARD